MSIYILLEIATDSTAKCHLAPFNRQTARLIVVDAEFLLGKIIKMSTFLFEHQVNNAKNEMSQN